MGSSECILQVKPSTRTGQESRFTKDPSNLTKSVSNEELFEALESVVSGERYLQKEYSELGEVTRNDGPLKIEKFHDPLGPLSPREREIFNLLAGGLQNTDIAKKLYISPRTVETHRARVVRKLGLSSNGELIRFAIKHGLAVV